MDLAPHRVPPEPSWRKPVGMLLIILYIALYALAVSALAETLAALPIWLQTIVYLVAGIVWILPLKPFILWMNTGRWSVK
jgi:Protein of unknown function (DUF2842)